MGECPTTHVECIPHTLSTFWVFDIDTLYIWNIPIAEFWVRAILLSDFFQSILTTKNILGGSGFSIFSTETKISETIVETWNNDKSCDAGLMEPRRRMCGWLQTLMPWMWQTRLGLSEDWFPIFRLDWAKSFRWYCDNFVSCIGLELQCNFSVWQCWRFLLWQWDCFWSPLNCHC